MRQQLRVLSGLAKRRGQRLQDVTLFDENGDPLSLSGGSAPVILSPSILPAGITPMASTVFGYVKSGGLVHFFGSFIADGSSPACVGDEPFLPLNVTKIGGVNDRPYYLANGNVEPSLVFIHNNGLWANTSLTGDIHIGGISFVGSID